MLIKPTHLKCFFLWLPLLGSLLLSSCDQEKGSGLPSLGVKEPKRILFAVCADSFATPMRHHQILLFDRLVHMRAGMDVINFDAEGSAATQSVQVQAALEKGASYLVVFPQDAQRLAPELKKALDKGVKVIALSDAVPAEVCTTRIHCGAKELGRIAGEYVLSALQKKATDEGQKELSGRVVQIRSEESGGVSASLSASFLETLAKVPGVVLVHDAPAYWSPLEATARMKEALTLQKNFEIVFAHNDSMGLGAHQATLAQAPETRESMLILGIDGASGKRGGMEMVMHGELDATVYQPPLVDVAWHVVQQMLDGAAFVPKPDYRVKPFMITPENAAELYRKVLPVPIMD